MQIWSGTKRGIGRRWKEEKNRKLRKRGLTVMDVNGVDIDKAFL